MFIHNIFEKNNPDTKPGGQNKYKPLIMNKIYLICLLFASLFRPALSDEGMWLLPLLGQKCMDEMKELGIEITAEDIYNLQQSSLKDAIVIFGRGCTGEIISDQGLVLTNHHCGYDAIQYHSSVNYDYLKNGFWASTFEEELHTPELSVRFLERIENVTPEITASLTPIMTESERNTAIEKAMMDVEDSLEQDNKYTNVSIRSFYENTVFYLMVYKEYPDVRFVGAPPSSIGKFGADTDNWTWPRHTGDFSLFRVYTDSLGEPAEYSEKNIPLKPKKFLKISLEGYEEGDFSMILGYPGNTQRYASSYEIEESMEIVNKNRIKIRGIRQEIMMEYMQRDEKIRIQYATKYARSSNYWKYSIGQNKGLKQLNVIGEKKQLEDDFQQWISQQEERKEKYGQALHLIRVSIEGRRESRRTVLYAREALQKNCELFGFARQFKNLSILLKTDETEIDYALENLREAAGKFYKNYHAPLDKDLTKAMIRLYHEEVPLKFQPEFFKEIRKKDRKHFDKFVDKMFKKSIFPNEEKLYEFLENPKYKILKKDRVFQTALSIYDKYKEIYDSYSEYESNLDKGNRLFLTGLMEMKAGKDFYPDANFTMRLTYGTVKGYSPRDGVIYKHYTNLGGVMEKEDPDNREFVVPATLKALYNQKDYGPYGAGGTMKTCFITNHDITGGNSGSPVLNDRGELMGLAFDGNWEAMTGDISFEPRLQRCINVDIRYVLFVIDKFAGADRLIQEMEIIQ